MPKENHSEPDVLTLVDIAAYHEGEAARNKLSVARSWGRDRSIRIVFRQRAKQHVAWAKEIRKCIHKEI